MPRRTTGRSGSSRYAPGDRVSTRRSAAGTARSPVRSANRRGARVGTSRAAPNLVPRRAAPRLGAPRRANSRTSAFRGSIRGRAFTNTGFARRGFRNSLWNGYWGWGQNNFCGFGGGWGLRNNWGWGGGFGGWGGGFGFGGGWGGGIGWGGGFGGGWGFGTGWGFNNCFGYGAGWGFDPWISSIGWGPRSNFWNNAYYNCYWNNRAIPNALPSSYWWYPNNVYCPTFLSVPSSVIVVDDGFVVGGGGGGYVDEGEVTPAADAGSIVRGARSDEAASPEPPSLAEKYIELGDFYFKGERYDDAAEAYAKARVYLPNDASVHFVLADAVFANGDYHYAAFLISEAVRLDPTIVTADVDKRTFYAKVRSFEDQLTALQRYCAEKPYDAWAQLVLGYNLRFSDRPTRAIAAFRRVLELDKKNVTARTFLEDLVAKPARATDRATDGAKAGAKGSAKERSAAEVIPAGGKSDKRLR